jgi:hypothetical protein
MTDDNGIGNKKAKSSIYIELKSNTNHQFSFKLRRKMAKLSLVCLLVCLISVLVTGELALNFLKSA